jgi:hypothetical protein
MTLLFPDRLADSASLLSVFIARKPLSEARNTPFLMLETLPLRTLPLLTKSLTLLTPAFGV